MGTQTCHWRASSALVTLVMMLTAMLMPVAQALDKTWTLYHSWNGGQDFARRASVLLSIDPDTDGVALSITNDNSTVNKESYLAAKETGAMYQLKLVEDSGAADNGDSFVLSSVPGCQLLRANFRYVLYY